MVESLSCTGRPRDQTQVFHHFTPKSYIEEFSAELRRWTMTKASGHNGKLRERTCTIVPNTYDIVCETIDAIDD